MPPPSDLNINLRRDLTNKKTKASLHNLSNLATKTTNALIQNAANDMENLKKDLLRDVTINAIQNYSGATGPGSAVDLTNISTNIIPKNNSTYNLGGTGQAFNNIHSSGTLYTSQIKTSQIQIGDDSNTKITSDSTGNIIVNKCIDNGLLVLTAKSIVRLLPPLIISHKDINKGLAVLNKVLYEYTEGRI